jgi:hypothetical protein
MPAFICNIVHIYPSNVHLVHCNPTISHLAFSIFNKLEHYEPMFVLAVVIVIEGRRCKSSPFIAGA